MAMQRIALFEDRRASDFSPLTLLRPTFELRCGHFTPRERMQAALPNAEWSALLRPWLAEVYAEEHPGVPVNDESWLRQGPTLLINGRWLGDVRSIDLSLTRHVGIIDDEIAWLFVDPDESVVIDPADCEDGIARIAATRQPVAAGGSIVHRPWDLIVRNGEQLACDYHSRTRRPSKVDLPGQTALQGRGEDIFIHPKAEVDPFVVLDARGGPVWVEEGARLLPFTRVEGPAYIGRDAQVFRAHVRSGTSIGPVCRVGGEIEESILHGYANKYHDGFLGHSYVCPWVNLGALTSNSDLKNDYSNVKVPLSGESIDTGSPKIGCFIGDHSKTALASLFNTGSSIGVMTMVLPAGELLPKFLPSFSRYWHGRIEALPGGLESSLTAAQIAMSRRQQTLTPAMERLLRHVETLTSADRQRAAARASNTSVPSQPTRV